jgi:hypothetical protein
MSAPRGGGSTTSNGGGSVVGGTAGSNGCQPEAPPGATPLTKLSTVQYRNTVRDLLTTSALSSLVAEVEPLLAGLPDDSPITFRGLDARISFDHIQTYFKVAVAVGDALEKSEARLTAVAGSCASAAPLSAQCVDAFLQSFGRRALRRPLNAEENTALRALNDGVRSPAEALRAMVVTLLMSPAFVNHLELQGAPVSAREDYLVLDAYEIASRLSYTFWQTLPDAALMTAAEDGSLTTDPGFARELERVFADPRTRETLWQFWNEWFRMESFTGFAADRPGFESLAAGENVGVAGHDHHADMLQELRDLTDLYTWKQKGTLSDLLTTDVSVTRSADLARLYGVPVWSGSGDYPRFTDGSRSGILLRAGLLVSSLETTNPFHRGSLVRRSILCDPLPQPDANSLPPGSLDPPPVTATESTRQRFAKKVDGNSLCIGCHSIFSDIGYVLESYDSLGRFRTTERVFDEQTGKLLAELPIDASAVPRIDLADMTPVESPAQLNQRILQSGKVEGCLSGNYFRFALRREPSPNTSDTCVYEELRAGLGNPDLGLAGVFKRLAEQPSFRLRKVGSP